MNAHRLVLLPLLLTACAAPATRFPSLLPRPIEGMDLAEPNRPVPVATPDAALDRQLADWRRQADAADRDFTARATRAARLASAAAGAGEGSPAWIDAQVSLAELDVARGAIDTPVSALERAVLDRSVAGAPPYPALDAALAAVQQQAAAQRARIAGIAARLR